MNRKSRKCNDEQRVGHHAPSKPKVCPRPESSQRDLAEHTLQTPSSFQQILSENRRLREQLREAQRAEVAGKGGQKDLTDRYPPQTRKPEDRVDTMAKPQRILERPKSSKGPSMRDISASRPTNKEIALFEVMSPTRPGSSH